MAGRKSRALGPQEIRLWPSNIWGLWHREFHDVRLILEQEGDLQYYAIPARWQRLLSRSAIVAAAMAVLSLVLLAALATHLHLGKLRLEESHQEIYRVLLGSTHEAGGSAETQLQMDQEDMMLLAQSIQARNMAIQRYADSATHQLGTENSKLQQHLNATGLTERAIKIIQKDHPSGGSSRIAQDENVASVVSSVFLENSTTNRALNDVLNALPAKFPIADHVVTSAFGMRNHPIHGKARFHAGIDLISTSSDDVFAAKAGTVVLARFYNDYGNTVIVRHERGVETLYAHLASIAVKEGQQVELSTLLGVMGNTGASTGKHLHFEVSVGGYPVDPLKVINTAHYVQQAKN
jgi:murein DD-endopeptidase MepM/ murein hydrolase activator NlpD